MSEKNKKIVKKFIAVLVVVFLSFNQACAGLFDLSPGDVMNEVEERYGFDQNMLRRAKQKYTYPQVEIYFDNTNPKEGDEITATAVPMNFKNNIENLYYTWFLLRKDDDLNDDDLMDKISRRTMKIVARGNFDPSLFAVDYSNISGDLDEDGFKAPIGGKDGTGAKEDGTGVSSYEENCFSDAARELVNTGCITRCYRHNFGQKFNSGGDNESGKDLVVDCEHKFSKPNYGENILVEYEDINWEKNGETTTKSFTCERDPNGNKYEIGDGKLTTGEEICWGTDPENSDTDGDGIYDEADLAGLAQQEFAWKYQEGDKIGVWIEGTSSVPTNEDTLNSYYKIIWASTGVCSDKDKSFIEGDGCDNDDDFGFPFVEFKEVEEEKEQNVQASLAFSPNNPQVDSLDEDLTTTIKVNGMLQGQGKNEGVSYFEWEIYKCDGNDTENCSQSGYRLTEKCQHGDQLGVCAKSKEGETAFESNSYVQGMGVSEISFKPKKELFTSSEDTEYLKVYLKIKRYKTDAKFSLSEIIIPVTKGALKIKFFKISEQENGRYGFKDEDEICNVGLYKTLCPLFPRQVIAAKIEFADKSKYDSDETTYSWKINDLDVGLPNECELFNGSEGGELCSQTSQDNIIYFPIKEVNDENNINVITASVKLINGEKETDLTSTRAYVVDNPVAIISSENQDTAWPTILHDGTTDDSFFETTPGNQVTFKAEIVPDYLKIGEDIDLTWTLDGIEITEELINSEENKELGISLEDNKISFNILGKVGSGSQLSANLYMPFSSDQLVLLQKNWDISDSNPIENTSSIGIKRVYVPEEEGEETASLKMFLASTAKNAPEYLIFILRLAIVLTIIWGAVFGADYLIKPRKL